ncbi:MAG: hypothetical protein LCI00_31080 [Chloroflexi bacterium]|nr:hypothetical protein [Chloroflexota bacterium]MCC6893322.1 hypothetical protein [Anaerolineae bacterium]
MSSLNTFGAILSYAIEQEARLAEYFNKAGNADQASAAEKRKGKLERARSLYVLEITLEPIEGLDEANYALNLDDTSPAGQKNAAATAARFYAEVAPYINVRDAQRILEKCGKEYAALA